VHLYSDRNDASLNAGMSGGIGANACLLNCLYLLEKHLSNSDGIISQLFGSDDLIQECSLTCHFPQQYGKHTPKPYMQHA